MYTYECFVLFFYFEKKNQPNERKFWVGCACVVPINEPKKKKKKKKKTCANTLNIVVVVWCVHTTILKALVVCTLIILMHD
jgi:hypothetical protein